MRLILQQKLLMIFPHCKLPTDLYYWEPRLDCNHRTFSEYDLIDLSDDSKGFAHSLALVQRYFRREWAPLHLYRGEHTTPTVLGVTMVEEGGQQHSDRLHHGMASTLGRIGKDMERIIEELGRPPAGVIGIAGEVHLDFHKEIASRTIEYRLYARLRE